MHSPHSYDQSAKIQSYERNDVMFPKGVKQMLGFIYAMEGEIAGNLSWHAKMIELRASMDVGYIQPFSLYRINLTGLDPVLINGECSGLRDQVEQLLGATQERAAVWAKFGKDELERTEFSIGAIAVLLRDHLTSGRRKAQRSLQYCTDVVWSCCCASAMFDKKYNVSAIARRHQMNQPLVWKDCSEARAFFSRTIGGAYKKIEDKFGGGEVLP